MVIVRVASWREPPRTQGIGQRGKVRAYLDQPKADWGQTCRSLALSWTERERTYLGPTLTCAELGPVGSNLPPKGPNLAQLGPKVLLGWSWAQRDPDGFQIEAMWCTWASRSCFNMPQLGLWRQLHTELGPTETHHADHCFKRRINQWKRVFFASARAEVPTIWGPSWGNLAHLRLEPSWAEVGAQLAGQTDRSVHSYLSLC